MERRKDICPECKNGDFLVLEDNRVICSKCGWSTESKRLTDNLLSQGDIAD